MAKRVISNSFGPIGFCIYCKRRDLPADMSRFSDEHILPRSLGGKIILRESSCNDCAKIINSGFETGISKEVMGDARHKHGASSRHRKPGNGAPTTKTVKSKWGWDFEVPLSDYPVSFPIYNYGTATLITGGLDPSLDGNGWWELFMQNEDVFHDAHKAFQKKYPFWKGTFEVVPRPALFARLAAKVAYGIALCQLGPNSFDEDITPVIMGFEPQYSRYVGGSREGYVNAAGTPAGFAFKLIGLGHSKLRLVMDYQMFPKGPLYHVVLGTLNLEKPQHLETFSLKFEPQG